MIGWFFFYKTWWEFTPSRGHIRYIILALSGILVSPDIWVHFRIRIEIPDHFDSVLRIDVGIDDGAQVCVPHGHSSVDEMKPHIIKYPSNKRSEATCLSGQAPIGRVGLETAQKTQLCEQYDGRRSTIHRLWYYKSPQKLISRLSFQNPRPTLPNRPTSSARWNRGKVGLIVNNSASWLTWRGSKRLVDQRWFCKEQKVLEVDRLDTSKPTSYLYLLPLKSATNDFKDTNRLSSCTS